MAKSARSSNGPALPAPPPIVHTHAGAGGNVAAAKAAIATARANRAAEEGAPASGDGPRDSAPVGSATPTTSAPAPAPAPAAEKKPAAPPPRRDPDTPKAKKISGRDYKAIKADQAKALLEDRDVEIAQLRDQLKVAAPIAEGATDEGTKRVIAEGLRGVWDLVAYFTGVDAVRMAKAKADELGELGAPAIKPYMGAAAAYTPLIAFGIALASDTAEKIMLIRKVKSEERAPSLPPAVRTPANGNGTAPLEVKR